MKNLLFRALHALFYFCKDVKSRLTTGASLEELYQHFIEGACSFPGHSTPPENLLSSPARAEAWRDGYSMARAEHEDREAMVDFAEYVGARHEFDAEFNSDLRDECASLGLLDAEGMTVA